MDVGPARAPSPAERPAPAAGLGSTAVPAPAPEPALEAISLSKRYWRGAQALSDVSLRVAPGSVTALVGPNAAGKSTLIKTWVAFERPTHGAVRVRGVDPWQDRAGALAHLGYVPQQPALYRGLSVSDHLDLAAHVRRGFDRDGAVAHLDELAIPLGGRPTALSGGQQAQVDAGHRPWDASGHPASRRAPCKLGPAGSKRVPGTGSVYRPRAWDDRFALVTHRHGHRTCLRSPDRAGSRPGPAR